jgi:hypothetical protein
MAGGLDEVHDPAENEYASGHDEEEFQGITENVAAFVVLDESQHDGDDQGEDQHGD